MKRLVALLPALALFACSGSGATMGAPLSEASPSVVGGQPAETPTLPEQPFLTPTAAPSLSPGRSPVIERSNFLLLGRDWRAHREGTGRGYQTDVMVLVSVLESDPIQITAIQYPRNLYVPVDGYPPTWLFSTWREGGFAEVRDYWRQAFGIELHGIMLTTMDSFVQVANDLGMDGEATLAFLRDNLNNWGYGNYDHEQRTFQVLQELWARSQIYFLSDPVAALNAVVRWSEDFELDLGGFSGFIQLFQLGWKVRSNPYELRLVQLESPALKWAPVPNLNVPRGWVANTDLVEWTACVLDWSCDG